MFDLPDAKRIRRDDILSRDSSSSPSPPPDDAAYPDAQARLSALLNLDFAPAEPNDPVHATSTAPPEDAKDDEDEEQEFEFRLFSGPAPTETSTKDAPNGTSDSGAQKLRIRLRSPTPTTGADGEGRFVKPFRGWSYYFTAPGLLSGEKTEIDGAIGDEGLALKRKQFEDVAVSGEDMVRFAGVPWPGCDLPWRVIRLKREHTKLPPGEKGTKITCVPESVERTPLSRKKPGKKRRIQLRKRAVVAERARETEAEKRNRKNREKKIKRRQKAREQKAAAAAGVGYGGSSDPNQTADEPGRNAVDAHSDSDGSGSD
ncbi:hypothetical protein BJX64DRAFT_33449 [Aspergillus heterothallicus]